MGFGSEIKDNVESIKFILNTIPGQGFAADAKIDELTNTINDLNSSMKTKDMLISSLNLEVDKLRAFIEDVATALHYVPDDDTTLINWAEQIYAEAGRNVVTFDIARSVKGWACWGSLYGGSPWDQRTRFVDHLSVTQRWNKWDQTVGFGSAAEATRKANKGLWVALHPGPGPELPPNIQTLVPLAERINTTIKGASSWYVPWWNKSVMTMWKSAIQSMADLHASDAQLRMVRAVIPPMAMGEPYMDGAPSTANKNKWVAAWRAAGKGAALSDQETWESLCNDYYHTLAEFIEYLASLFPERVGIAVASGIGMGDTSGNKVKSMILSLKEATRKRICLQYNGLSHIPKKTATGASGEEIMTWDPNPTHEWILKTAEIAKSIGVVLGYQTVTGAAGGGPGPMGLDGLDKALAVGKELGMSYCEIYSTDIDAQLAGQMDISSILNKWA